MIVGAIILAYLLIGTFVISILASVSKINAKDKLSCIKLVPVWPIVLWIVILMRDWRMW